MVGQVISGRMMTVVLGLACLAAFSRDSAFSAGEGFVLDREARIAIVRPENPSPQQFLAVDDLTRFLQRTLKAVVRTYAATAKISEIDEPACFLFGTAQDNALLADLSRRAGVTTDGLGREGSLVRAVKLEGKALVFLSGEAPTGACYAAYSFLENELAVGFFIDGNQVPRLQHVSLEGLNRREVPAASIRGLFYHPTWRHPHANCWRLWGWKKWRETIDWMRRKRFNALPLFHDEGTYFFGDAIFKAFPEIERNDQTLAHYVVDPAWRTALNHKIFQYARDSGVAVAYNLFYSQVPDFFADFRPDLEYYPLSMYNVGISAIQPDCKEIMKRFWKEIFETYGLDDFHIYLVCSYQHESPLPDYYQNHNAATLQMMEVLKELDLEAKIYMETWCWKYHNPPPPEQPRHEWLTENFHNEWKAFHAEIPREVGVVEWDNLKDPERVPDHSFDGRPYIQLVHTTMEGWWPPSTARRHPQWMIDYFSHSLDQGADGVMYFHIQAGTNMILADLGARIGLERNPSVEDFYQDYARRRFGSEVAETLAESLGLFCDAVAVPKPDVTTRWTVDDLTLSFNFPGFQGSAEAQLAQHLEAGSANPDWLDRRLAVFREKAGLLGSALLLARSVAPRLKDHQFYQQYCWELDYMAARMEGITALYRSHRLASEHPRQSRVLFKRSLSAFDAVKELFRNLPGHWMSKLRDLEPDVPYTSAYLKDWETRGQWFPKVQNFHVVWERMGEFEARIRALEPE